MALERMGLKIDEVAQALGVSESWVYEQIALKRLPAVKLNPGKGAVRVRPEDLKVCIEKRLKPPKESCEA